jgi:hypothetical protein
MRRSRRHGKAREVLEGALAGAAGSFVMGQVSGWLWAREGEAAKLREKIASSEPAPARAGRLVLERLGIEVRQAWRPKLGEAVHYATGALFGGAYGLLRTGLRHLPRTGGLLFGAAIWLFNDELLTTLLGLSPPPRRYPLVTHARGLAAHLVYGASVDAGLRAAHAVR